MDPFVIEMIKLFHFSIPLLSKKMMRKGLLIQIKWSQGKITWGEISPLPSFSKEDLIDAQDQLISIIPSLLHRNSEDLLSWLKNQNDLFPSVSFGLFGAFYSF